MSAVKTKRLLLLFIVNFLILSVAMIYNMHFENELISDCVILKTFGFYCPGCGGSRALNHLLHLRFIKSFIYYPPLLITSLLIAYADVCFMRAILYEESELKWMKPKLFYFVPNSIILSFLVKNILIFFGVDLLGNLL